jgi:hypothetical protein
MVCSLPRRIGLSVTFLSLWITLGGCPPNDATSDVSTLANSLPDATPTDCDEFPVADAGADIEATDPDDGGFAYVYLDARKSTPADRIFVYAWSDGDKSLAAGRYILVRLAVGTHEVTLRIEDECGQTTSDSVTVVVHPALNAAPALASAR